jgi:hypothetical protein
MLQALLALSVLVCGAPLAAATIARGSAWKYLDNNSNQGTAWRAVSFNDAGWTTGNAQVWWDRVCSAPTRAALCVHHHNVVLCVPSLCVCSWATATATK